jgi:hypothetical protein
MGRGYERQHAAWLAHSSAMQGALNQKPGNSPRAIIRKTTEGILVPGGE